MKQREVVATKKAPAAVGPYSQGIKIPGVLFAAGQIALDPETGKLVGDDITAQTEQVMKNHAAILEAAGSSMKSVVKTTVFLRNLADFKAFNAAYAAFFPESPPARLAVGGLDLPLGALVEVDLIALAPE